MDVPVLECWRAFMLRCYFKNRFSSALSLGRANDCKEQKVSRCLCSA